MADNGRLRLLEFACCGIFPTFVEGDSRLLSKIGKRHVEELKIFLKGKITTEK